MDSFDSYLLRKLYVKTARLGDKLAEVEPLIDWDAFTPIIQPMYSNQRQMGGRPNTDPVVMVKLLVLQAWYGLSDPELERQVDDRLSFQRVLGFPEKASDYSTPMCLILLLSTYMRRALKSGVNYFKILVRKARLWNIVNIFS